MFIRSTMEAPAPGWSELPADILCSVLGLLECPDLLRSAAVCTAWHRAYSTARSISIFPTRQTPCLLYNTDAAAGLAALGLYSLSERKAYTMPLPESPPKITNWVGSSHGWLVAMDENSELTLLNPVTRASIALPPVTTMEHVKPILNADGVLEKYEMFFYDGAVPRVVEDTTAEYSLDEYGDSVYDKAILSCDPSEGERCIVMLIHLPYSQLSFARVGDDRWNWLKMHSYYSDCVYHDGWFYAMGEEGAIDMYNLSERSAVIHRRILPDTIGAVRKCHIVLQAQSGDVLQVIRRDTPDPGRPDGTMSYITGFTAYKVDLDEQKCVQITSIGDYAIFIGKSTTSCFSVKEYPHLMPNHVYFTDDSHETVIDYKDEPRNIGIYNLGDNTRTNVVYPELWMPWLPPIWLTPSLGKTGFRDNNSRRQ